MASKVHSGVGFIRTTESQADPSTFINPSNEASDDKGSKESHTFVKSIPSKMFGKRTEPYIPKRFFPNVFKSNPDALPEQPEVFD